MPSPGGVRKYQQLTFPDGGGLLLVQSMVAKGADVVLSRNPSPNLIVGGDASEPSAGPRRTTAVSAHTTTGTSRVALNESHTPSGGSSEDGREDE